jgi:hypothetical protein
MEDACLLLYIRSRRASGLGLEARDRGSHGWHEICKRYHGFAPAKLICSQGNTSVCQGNTSRTVRNLTSMCSRRMWVTEAHEAQEPARALRQAIGAEAASAAGRASRAPRAGCMRVTAPMRSTSALGDRARDDRQLVATFRRPIAKTSRFQLLGLCRTRGSRGASGKSRKSALPG